MAELRWLMVMGVAIVLTACQHPITRDDARQSLSAFAMGGASTIWIDPSKVRHAASPYVMSFNRNHNHRQFERHKMSYQAMDLAMAQLAPKWGDTYLEDLRQAGYPAKSDARSLYRNGHGPTDGRLDYPELTGYRFLEMWNLDGRLNSWDGYCYDDFRYFLSEARAWNSELLVTVNFGSDSPQSAGQLAAYLNRPVDPLKMQYPLHGLETTQVPVKLPEAFMFEIGNELQLPQQIGHTRARTIEQYVQESVPYIQQIRHESPHPVKIALAAAVNVFWGGPAGWQQQGAMIDAFMQACARNTIQIEALQYHGYPKYPISEKLAGPTYADQLTARTLLPVINRVPHQLEIWNNECHADSKAPRNTGLYGALHQAATIAYAFNRSHRQQQLTPVVTDFALWHAGKTNGNDSLYFQNNNANHTTPIYALRRLLAANWGDWIINSQWNGGEHWLDHGRGNTQTKVPGLLVSASLSADGHSIHALIINQTRTTPISAHLAWPKQFELAEGSISRLVARPGKDGWDAAWNEVLVLENQRLAPLRNHVWPAASISLVTLPIRQSNAI